MDVNPPILSLLWPDGELGPSSSNGLDPQVRRDLELDLTLNAFTGDGVSQSQIREILCQLCTNPKVISYRQDILDDIWQQPTFKERLTTLWPDLRALQDYRSSVDRSRSALQDVTWRLGELEQLVTCVNGLVDIFTALDGQLSASGWARLREGVEAVSQTLIYQALQQELPEMLQTIRAKASVTIGVNLDNRLRPVGATLLAVNDQPFTSSTFMDRLLGRQGEADLRGLGPLHTVPKIGHGRDPFDVGSGPPDLNPLMVPLFNDLSTVLETVCRPIARALRQYVSLQSGFLGAISGEVAFYLAAVRLMTRLQSQGLSLCRPDILPVEDRRCELDGVYNLNLALVLSDKASEASLVTNDVRMGADGRIFILTGPNQGGKTTYTQMLGLCHLLAQAGLRIPGTQAALSPVDNIYTHYPLEETLETATGRFGDEAQRLSQVFERATRYSLILFNESLASTSAGESLYLAQDIVRILRRMGTRAVFATHLHELAADVTRLNRETEGDSQLVSMVASRIETEGEGDRRSYKIVPGEPMGRSYAREIAAKYGISYEQLSTLLRNRNVLNDP